MKEFLIIANYVVGIGELILAWYFWKTHSGSAIRKVMVLLAFSTGMWVILTALTTYVSSPFPFFNIVFSCVLIFALILLTSLLHFAILYPHPTIYLERFHIFFLYIPTLVFSYAILFTSAVVKKHFFYADAIRESVRGEMYVPYNLYLLILYILIVIILTRKLSMFHDFNHYNLKIVLAGILLGGIPPVILDLVLTSFGIWISPLYAPLFTVIWLGTTTYIIVRK